MICALALVRLLTVFVEPGGGDSDDAGLSEWFKRAVRKGIPRFDSVVSIWNVACSFSPVQGKLSARQWHRASL
jgi:hypothetical protein